MLDALALSPLKALLFDLDGTLVDSVPDLAAAVDAVLTQLKLPVAGECQVRNWVGNGARVLVQRALAYGHDTDEEAIDQQQLQAAYQQFLSCYQQLNGTASRVYPGVINALEHWRKQGIKMAVVTNKPSRFIPSLLQQCQIANYFVLTVGADTLAEKKPAPAPLLYACQQLGVDPQAAIMVGDSRTDVQAARAVPIPVVAVSYGYNHGDPIVQAGPDAVVDSLIELI